MSGCIVSWLLIAECSFTSAALVLACDGMCTAMIIIAVNFLKNGKYEKWSAFHSHTVYSRCREKCFSIASVVVHQTFLTYMHTPSL